MANKASENNGIGMIHGSQEAIQSEYIANDPGQMANENKPNYTGQRNNRAAIGIGRITRLPQIRNTRTERIGSGAEMKYGHQIYELFGIFGLNGPGFERINRGSKT